MAVDEGAVAAVEIGADELDVVFVEDAQFPELDLSSVDVGVFGKVVSKPEAQALADGDRVEIYRPLIADPKEVRKQRAAKAKALKDA